MTDTPNTPGTGPTRPQDGRTGGPATPCPPNGANGPQTGTQRRERYAAAIARDTFGRPDDDAVICAADAAMVVADAEQHALYRLLSEARYREDQTAEQNARLTRAAGDRARYPSMASQLDAAQRENARLRDERDRARRLAVALESQLAAVRAMHQPQRFTTSDICGHCSGWGGDGTWPAQLVAWPCDTVRAIKEQP
ncbi:hypothetical protein [Streptomyces reniochalinae]|uniref:hypothetical protein n=1 Tax=Streptomyces reniochalinae TaxID=2250578 RepID=UPI0011C02906|nr:hypothetical protein [Streptomyces reniochalinae]